MENQDDAIMEGRGQRVKYSKDCKRVQSSFSSSLVCLFFFASGGHKPQKSKNASSEAEEEKVFRPPQLELSELESSSN